MSDIIDISEYQRTHRAVAAAGNAQEAIETVRRERENRLVGLAATWALIPVDRKRGRKLERGQQARMATNLHGILDDLRSYGVKRSGIWSASDLRRFQLSPDLEGDAREKHIDGLAVSADRYVRVALEAVEAARSFPGNLEDLRRRVLARLVEGVEQGVEEAGEILPGDVVVAVQHLLRAGSRWVIAAAGLDKHFQRIADHGLILRSGEWTPVFEGDGSTDELHATEPATPLFDEILKAAVTSDADVRIVREVDLVVARGRDPVARACLRLSVVLEVSVSGMTTRHRLEPIPTDPVSRRIEKIVQKHGTNLLPADLADLSAAVEDAHDSSGTWDGVGYWDFDAPEFAKLLQLPIHVSPGRETWAGMLAEGTSLGASGSLGHQLDLCLRGGASEGVLGEWESPDAWATDPSFAPPEGWPLPNVIGPIEHLYVQAVLLSRGQADWWSHAQQAHRRETQAIADAYEAAAKATTTTQV